MNTHEDTENSVTTINSVENLPQELEQDPKMGTLENEEEEAYRALYYAPQKVSYGAVSLWFATFYCLLSIPILFAVQYVTSGLKQLSSEFKGLNFNTEIFICSSVFGLIAFVLAIISFFTFRARKQSLIPGVIAFLLVAANAIASYFLFFVLNVTFFK